MVHTAHRRLDKVFGALADRTRRGILTALASGGHRAVSELAEPFAMSLPGFMKHLAVLEEAGLLSRTKMGRVVHCTLSAGPMQAAADWLAHYEAFWASRLLALERYFEQERSWPASARKVARSRPSASSERRRTKSAGRSRGRRR
jgi:DNA-binding transcriptional ArsR family regulator